MGLENIMGQETILEQKTELREVFDNLDSDVVDKKTKMSTVDFNTRLTQKQISACLIFDEFVRMGILEKEWGITRQLKRLATSRDGLSRREKVAIVANERDFRSGGNFGDKLKGLFQRQ